MVKLSIIEDNTGYRNTLYKILMRNKKIQILHSMDSCAEMIPYFEVDTPDVVIMDIDLPGISGIEGVWLIKQRWPAIKVLMLTVFEEPEKIFGAIKAGANATLILLKEYLNITFEPIDNWEENLTMTRAFREFYYHADHH